jgi:hypothetical protein
LRISNWSGNSNLNFGTGSRSAPELQGGADFGASFPHTRKAVMAHSTALAKDSGIDARTIVAKSDSEFDKAKMDFYLNLAGLGMSKGVKERLTANLYELSLHNGIEFLAVPTYYDVKLHRSEKTKLSSKCRKGLRKTLRS